MSVAAASPANERLQRLAAYLEQDPGNEALLAEACDAAIACGAHDQAEAFIAAADALPGDTAPWLFRRARIAIARRELARAADLLQSLRQLAGRHPVLDHDLGYVHLLQGDALACRELVQPWLHGDSATVDPEALAALQLLWVRALHRLQALDELMEWARAQADAGALAARAQGAASLVAIDTEDFAVARAWADTALAVDPQQPEALLARGSVALADGETAQAMGLLQRALQCNPEDGRIWSALGLASLQAQDLPGARSQLERAVTGMPGHVGTWHALGWACLLQHDRAAALAAFRQALEIDRNFAETHGALGLLTALAGDAEGARHHLDVAERLDPRNVTGHYARALLAGDAGDRAAMERLSRRLLDRPGFFGGTLADTVLSRTRRRD